MRTLKSWSAWPNKSMITFLSAALVTFAATNTVWYLPRSLIEFRTSPALAKSAADNPFQAVIPGWLAAVVWTNSSASPLLSFQHPINFVAGSLQLEPASRTLEVGTVEPERQAVLRRHHCGIGDRRHRGRGRAGAGPLVAVTVSV